MRRHRELAQPWSTGLRLLNVSEKARAAAEEKIRVDFKHWWDSWIAPQISEVERRLVKKTKSTKRPEERP